MSTLDAQLLTLSSMLVRDVLQPFVKLGQRAEVRAARGFTLGLAAVVYLLSITWGESVFEISRKAFSGYTTLVPTLLLGLRWPRFGRAAACVSMLTGFVVLASSWVWPELPTLGFLPVFWAFLAATAAGVAVALIRPRTGSS